jgi:hypothetical protein
MANYWVAPPPEGKDTYPGTFDKPWATVQKAADTALAGDIVNFKDGTYDCPSPVSFDKESGSLGRPITFRAQHHRKAVWESAGRVCDITRDHLILEGMVLSGDTGVGLGAFVSLSGCNYVIFSDCEIRNTQGHGMFIENSSSIKIMKCEIHNETHWEDTGLSMEGIFLYSRVSRVLIDSCHIYHTSHTGISIRDATSVMVRNCHIHDTSSHGIAVGCGSATGTQHDVALRDNVIDHCGAWRLAADAKAGVYVNYGAEELKIFKNDIYKNDGPGLIIMTNAYGPITVRNNTFYANQQAMVYDWGDISVFYRTPDSAPRLYIENNIIYNTTGLPTVCIESEVTSDIQMDHNLYYSSVSEEIWRDGTCYTSYSAYKAAGYEPHTVISREPKFTETVGESLGLRLDSPAVDAGLDVGEPYSGDAPDIGAHERYRVYMPIAAVLGKLTSWVD